MKLIFLGPPGSGKGTQAKKIAKDLSVSHISMGDILREHIKKGTEIGKKASEFLKNGMLVPDSVVNEIAKAEIEKNKNKGFVLDGYPRTVEQADFVLSITDIDRVIYIDVSKPEIVKRLAGRKSCKNCGAVYNAQGNPSKRENICDACGGELYVRNDDTEQVIDKRFEVYEKETGPLRNYYESKIVKIDGMDSLESVFGKIKSAL